jgi:hypothetical protein
MLRSIANVVFVLCLTVWCGFALLMCVTVIQHGFMEIWPTMLHVLGRTNQVGMLSDRLVVYRLVGLLVLTLLSAYMRRVRVLRA